MPETPSPSSAERGAELEKKRKAFLERPRFTEGQLQENKKGRDTLKRLAPELAKELADIEGRKRVRETHKALFGEEGKKKAAEKIAEKVAKREKEKAFMARHRALMERVDERTEKKEREGLDILAKVFQEKGSDGLSDYLLNGEHPYARPTKEKLESDEKIKKYLKDKFFNDELGETVDDFIFALPSEEEYMDNVREKMKEASKDGLEEEDDNSIELPPVPQDTRGGSVPPEYEVEDADNLEEGDAPIELQPKRPSPKIEVSDVYAEAEERRRPVMRRPARKIDISSKDSGQVATASGEISNDEPLNDSDRPVGRRNRRATPVMMPQSYADYSTGIRESEHVQEYLDQVIEQEAGAIQNKLDEIIGYFLAKKQKNLSDAEAVHKYLIGPEIKGWFQGKEKKLQAKYKELLNHPSYKESLRKKGNKR